MEKIFYANGYQKKAEVVILIADRLERKDYYKRKGGHYIIIKESILGENIIIVNIYISESVSSVTQSCPTFCDPMNHSTPVLPVHHQLPESTQTHVYQVSDAIQPPYHLSSPSPPALNLSQHQGLFQ